MKTVVALLVAFTMTLGLGSLVATSVIGVGHHRMVVGLATTVCQTDGWHGPPTGNSSVDLATYNPMSNCPSAMYNNTAGKPNYWYSERISGNHMFLEILPYTGSCTGVRIGAWSPNDGWPGLGDYWYVHIAPSIDVGEWWDTASFGYTAVHMGTVLSSEVGGCQWTGPHVHQGGDNSGWSAIYRNTSLPGPFNTITPLTTVNRYEW
jgi:hypothetical protein